MDGCILIKRSKISPAFVAGAAIFACACTRVQEDGPALDTGGPAFVQDTGAEITIDVPYFDTPKEVTATKDAQETVSAAKEQCGNLLDDDLDGLVDEEGCHPTPNLRTDLQWLDLGVVDFPETVKGPAATRTFGAPAKNTAMVVYAEDLTKAENKAALWAETLVTPAGIEVLSPGQWANSYNRAFVGLGHATLLVGMAPQISVVAGPWQVGFTRAYELPLQYKGSPYKGTIHLGVVQRPPLAPNAMGTLDLDVYCVGGSPMPCAELAKSPQWQKIVARVNSIWADAHIQLGNVELIDISGDDGVKLKYLDNVNSAGPDNEFNQVYAATGKLRPKSTAATLVLVAGLLEKGMPVAAGLSQLAGLPGVPGARASGLAVVFDEKQWADALKLGPDVSYAADIWGIIIAHELGHFMGLWHTDEADGSLHDPIDDTPPCDKKAEVLEPDVCPVQAKYLMFWRPKGATVTEGQQKVVRLSPALR